MLSVGVQYPHSPTMKLHEFLVLGDQRLTVLRDAIECVTDLNMRNMRLYRPSIGSQAERWGRTNAPSPRPTTRRSRVACVL